MHTYSLPAVCWALTRRVARFRQTNRQPETLGSRVPEWPVFSQPMIFLIHDTTSCDDGFTGLSRLRTPYLGGEKKRAVFHHNAETEGLVKLDGELVLMGKKIFTRHVHHFDKTFFHKFTGSHDVFVLSLSYRRYSSIGRDRGEQPYGSGV